MANGNTFDPMASWARLSERVENQGKDIVDLRSNMNTGFQTLTSSVNSLANDMRSSGRTQWPIIIGFCSVSITVLGGLGFLALQPIKDNIVQIRSDARADRDSTKDGFAGIADKIVTQAELKWRTDRGIEDRQRTEAAIKDIRDALVPRAEHERVWQNYTNKDADLQRQIDEVKQAQGTVYGARDVILDLKANQQRLERELSEIKTTKGPG